MRDLSRLGVGWPGTPGELARREYIISRLETFGYACAREPFAFLAYSTEASSTCTSDILGDLLTGPIQYTANGTAEGQLTFVGQGHPEDLDALQEAGVDLRNRLCLARTFAPSTISDDLATWCDWTHRPSRYSGRSHPTPHRTWIPASAPTALDCGNRQDPRVTVSKGAGDRLLAMHGSGLGSVAIEPPCDLRRREDGEHRRG